MNIKNGDIMTVFWFVSTHLHFRAFQFLAVFLSGWGILIAYLIVIAVIKL